MIKKTTQVPLYQYRTLPKRQNKYGDYFNYFTVFHQFLIMIVINPHFFEDCNENKF